MHGILLVNNFVFHEKFYEIYRMLKASFEKRGVTLDIKKSPELGLELTGEVLDPKPDFIIFWDKDYYMAKRLESYGIRLFNSADAMLYCDNKILTYETLKEAGVRIPRTFVPPKTYEGIGYCDLSFLDTIDLPYPYVLKEAYGSFGKQVHLIHDRQEAEAIIKALWYKPFVIQEYIAPSCGRDVRVNVVGDRVIASMLRHNPDDFRSNITNGGTGDAYTPSEKQCALALEAAKALKLDYAGVDVLFGPNDEPIICEVNSNPHFVSTLKATGVNMAEYIAEYIIKDLCK